jgi:hypothetical protein
MLVAVNRDGFNHLFVPSSRPSGIPLASVADVQKNLPSTVRSAMRPSRAYGAAFSAAIFACHDCLPCSVITTPTLMFRDATVPS